MITDDDNTLLILNDLLLAARDAVEGFATAAENVKEPELIRLFVDYGKQRREFMQELEKRIRTLRGNPARPPNPLAAAHRTWMGLKAAIESNSTHALLEEVERGEDMSVRAYRMALEARDIEDPSRRLIQKQYELVQAAHDRVKQLRDRATYAHR